ncbi:transcription termination factor MTERF2, chloroplastic-like protein isoform X2 [Cinnamomum micranthum f. kanehirae]|uniref:Transcription termination factor MTERF2, chloroplastic-like protein isoform X2 n=1 Tax=Cinnamomum micranthum f. kanehirae TaxID=337451 RepID=A0A443N8S6_9MAGN|nr:transcription termination factor MTERF2, chloroplastic-like protein isoform X2 [Cinnamomum micranthum f. kanehirae]
MLLSFCRRKLQIQINVKHPIHPHILQNPLLKSISNLSDSPDKPSPTLSYLINSWWVISKICSLHASKRTKIKTTQKPDSVLEFLKTHGFSNAQITTLISAAPRLLCANVNKTLKPNVDFFRGLGISDSDITNLMTSDPGILMRGLKTQIIHGFSPESCSHQ